MLLRLLTILVLKVDVSLPQLNGKLSVQIKNLIKPVILGMEQTYAPPCPEKKMGKDFFYLLPAIARIALEARTIKELLVTTGHHLYQMPVSMPNA